MTDKIVSLGAHRDALKHRTPELEEDVRRLLTARMEQLREEALSMLRDEAYVDKYVADLALAALVLSISGPRAVEYAAETIAGFRAALVHEGEALQTVINFSGQGPDAA